MKSGLCLFLLWGFDWKISTGPTLRGPVVEELRSFLYLVAAALSVNYAHKVLWPRLIHLPAKVTNRRNRIPKPEAPDFTNQSHHEILSIYNSRKAYSLNMQNPKSTKLHVGYLSYPITPTPLCSQNQTASISALLSPLPSTTIRFLTTTFAVLAFLGFLSSNTSSSSSNVRPLVSTKNR